MRVLIVSALLATTSAWIEVVGNGRTVPPNELIPAVIDDTNFGRMCLGSASVKKTFKIRANSKAVTLTGNPAVKIENQHTNDSSFSVMTPAPGAQTIQAGSTVDSVVEFNPSENGIHYAMYRATSTDTDHPTYEFRISGDARVPALDASLTQYGSGFQILPIVGVRANAITSVSFILRNLEDCPANIDSITLSGSGAPHYKLDGAQLPLVVDFENFAPMYLTFTGPKSNGNYPVMVTVKTGITTATFGFTALITDGLTQQPTVKPTIDPMCMDRPNAADDSKWMDEEDQTCADYDKEMCDSGAGDWPLGSGQSAEKMCCVCGGGMPKPSPTMQPVSPTPQPTKAPTSSCENLNFSDGTKFYDAYGPAFDCKWFGSYTTIYCDLYGNQEHKGLTAKKACCSCGGGLNHNKSPTPAVCQDATLASGAPWHDSFGEKYNCGWYGSDAEKYCTKYGFDDDSKVEGLMASDACCACKTSTVPPTPVPAKQEEEDADTGGFDWGDQCSAGDGEFSLDLPTEKGVESVGKIPAGKEGVGVSLEAVEDIDIQLYDLDDTSSFSEGKAIVGWCSSKDKAEGVKNCGLLGKSGVEVLTYEGMEFSYSGYNGQDGKRGNEYITIKGSTTRRLMMRVYAYKTGTAKVTYSWAKSNSNCCKGVKRACGGSFTAEIGEKAYVQIGSIPTGKGDLRVELSSTEDVDVQLYDTDDTSKHDEGAAIVGYCSTKEKQAGVKNCGVLGGSKEESTTYQSRTYTYSGYNGVDGLKGNEFIEIAGETNRNLNMVFYGYKAGTATVTYSYTQPQ